MSLLSYYRLSEEDTDSVLSIQLHRYDEEDGDGLWVQFVAEFRGSDWGPNEMRIHEILTSRYVHNDTLGIHDRWIKEYMVTSPASEDEEILALHELVDQIRELR